MEAATDGSVGGSAATAASSMQPPPLIRQSSTTASTSSNATSSSVHASSETGQEAQSRPSAPAPAPAPASPPPPPTSLQNGPPSSFLPGTSPMKPPSAAAYTPPGPPSFARSAQERTVASHPLPFSPRSAAPDAPAAFQPATPLRTLAPGNAYERATAVDDTVPIHTCDLEKDDSGASAPFVRFSSHKVASEMAILNVASLGFGALLSLVTGSVSGGRAAAAPPLVRRAPLRCRRCGAYSNLYCRVAPRTGEWTCVLCSMANFGDGEYMLTPGEDFGAWPELGSRVVDYIDVGARRYSAASDAAMAAPVIFVIDEALDEPYLRSLQASLQGVLGALPPSTRVALVSYGASVSVYDLSVSGAACADVLSGAEPPSVEALESLHYGSGVYLAPLHACLPIASAVLASLRPSRARRVAEADRPRCLGAAVEVALALVRGPATDLPRAAMRRTGGSSRLIVCAGGPATRGPGAIAVPEGHATFPHSEERAMAHMERLGHEARRLECAVDLLCAGTCPVRVRLLQPLAARSGGTLVLHDDFGTAFGANVYRSIARTEGSRGMLEARASKGFAVSRVIGPVDAAAENRSTSSSSVASTSDQFSDVNRNTLALGLLSVERNQGIALAMELVDDFWEEFAYFQFVARFTSTGQAVVTRVVTVRLPSTESVSAYLASVDNTVAACLIAKKVVLEASTAVDAVELRGSLDERVKDMAAKFGKAMPKGRLWRFPNELSSLPEHLFHLRRGPLLGSIVGHEDERAVLRAIFLQADYDLSLRMVAPRLLLHHHGGKFEELPAADLALQSDVAFVLDHGTDIFIWLGSAVAFDESKYSAATAACNALAQELSEKRFPMPRVLCFTEGSSQARYVMARLIPAHKDPPYEQEAHFPQLRTLTPMQRAQLKSKFLPTDARSLSEWMKHLRLSRPQAEIA
eukprot:SM000122S25771  [mRNA]  locus=s122:246584:251015:+ [translate_table: standard]